MFLVEKANLTSHFKSITKKPPLIPKSYQQASRSFDEQVIFHLKTLAPATDSSFISLSWMSKAVAFLSTIHAESLDQISSLRAESECFQVLYMDYSVKVLDICNLISSAVHQLTERRMLMKLSLRLMNSSAQLNSGPAPEKLRKAKDALIRSVRHSEENSLEKYQRAKELIGELISGINSFPITKVRNGSDLIKRTLHGLGILTVFISSVLVSVLYGQSDLVVYRVPVNFLWSDSVNGVQEQMLDLMKSKSKLLEFEDTANRVVSLCDLLDEASVVDIDGDGGEERRVRLVNGVKEFGNDVTKYSDGVDELTNGVHGLFGSVLKRRNGVLDGVRKAVW